MKTAKILSVVLALVAVVFTAAPAFAQSGTAYGRGDAVAAATSLVRPSVVAIETRFDEPRLDDDYLFWQFLRGSRPLYGLWGSGFIYQNSDYVVTTAFLVEHAEFIRVVLQDGRSYSGELVGKNDDLNVAVIKVEWGPQLEPVSPPFGQSSQLKLGQPIAVVGKAINSNDTFASTGVISAIRKELPDSDEKTEPFLQFDASFELSFTGAPMVDVYGNVIGMVNRSVGGANINLGIPIDDVVMIAERLIAGDFIEPYLGLEVIPVSTALKDNGYAPRMFPSDTGADVEVDFGVSATFVDANSPAAIAGMQEFDFIYEMNDTWIEESYDWDSFKRTLSVGQLVMVKFMRKNAVTGEWEKQVAQIQIRAAPEDDEEEEE